jgi:phosphoglycolate phosphatase-like HAD superfamily hydrolase
VASLLVLWDVDFTLVNTPGVGWRLYQLAFVQLYGRELPRVAGRADMAGRTDRAISLEVLRLAGVDDPRGQVSRFEAALTKVASSVTGQVTATGTALPGAQAALAAVAELGEREPVWQSLLTGNVRAVAEVKLSPFGLTRHLDLDVGAYGDEHERRAELVTLARERASAAYGADFEGEATVLVGDTPLDVEAALTTGARAVGVATGRFTEDELAAAGAHAVLADLADTGQVLAAVLGADRAAELTSRDLRSAAPARACPG